MIKNTRKNGKSYAYSPCYESQVESRDAITKVIEYYYARYFAARLEYLVDAHEENESRNDIHIERVERMKKMRAAQSRK